MRSIFPVTKDRVVHMSETLKDVCYILDEAVDRVFGVAEICEFDDMPVYEAYDLLVERIRSMRRHLAKTYGFDLQRFDEKREVLFYEK